MIIERLLPIKVQDKTYSPFSLLFGIPSSFFPIFHKYPFNRLLKLTETMPRRWKRSIIVLFPSYDAYFLPFSRSGAANGRESRSWPLILLFWGCRCSLRLFFLFQGAILIFPREFLSIGVCSIFRSVLVSVSSLKAISRRRFSSPLVK